MRSLPAQWRQLCDKACNICPLKICTPWRFICNPSVKNAMERMYRRKFRQCRSESANIWRWENPFMKNTARVVMAHQERECRAFIHHWRVTAPLRWLRRITPSAACCMVVILLPQRAIHVLTACRLSSTSSVITKLPGWFLIFVIPGEISAVL